AGIDGHLAHSQALGVSAVVLYSHAARLVGPLPEDDVAVGPALYRLAAHALGLDTHHQLDPPLTQLASHEAVVEKSIRKDHVSGLERVVHLPQQGGLTGALAGVRRDGQVVAGPG